MEIKRTEKAFQITATTDSGTTSTRAIPTYNTSDSFETAIPRQQAELTRARMEFKEASNPPAQDPLAHAAEKLLDGGANGFDFLGGGFTPITPDFLNTHNQPGRQTENSKPGPTLNTETNQKQKYLNDLLESNRLRPTSSERDEKIRNVKNHSNLFPTPEPTSSVNDERIGNVKDHNNVQDFYPSIDPTSRANNRQAEFTKTKAEFQEMVEKREAIAEFVDLINSANSGFDDLFDSIDIIPDVQPKTSETNRKQKELTDLLASTRDALRK
jgi:hypothetical protein